MEFKDYRFNPVLKNKRVVVTGGTSGIGRATTILLASRGAKVLFFGRGEKELVDTIKDLNEITDAQSYGLVADTSTKEGLETVFSAADSKMGGVDILINNAATGGGSLLNEKFEDWKKMLDTNILGYLAFSRYALDRMLPQGGGQIVNVGSFSAVDRGADHEVYVAAKAAIQAFSESLRKTVNAKGIKVSLIEPGSVGTSMTSESSAEQRQLQEEFKMLTAEDIAEAILFCLIQPPRCEVVTVQIKPVKQLI